MSKEQWEKTRSELKAAKEACGEKFSEEDFLAIFPTSLIAPPMIPFTRISEDTFFDLYEMSAHFKTIPKGTKIHAENNCNRWDADVQEGTVSVWFRDKEYTARIEDLPYSWYDMKCVERVRNQAVAEGDINAYRIRIKPSHRSKVIADLEASPAFCETNPHPAIDGDFLKPRTLPCFIKGLKCAATDFTDLPYA